MSKAKKKKKYAIIQSADITKFCAQCNELLDKNYEPLGGINAFVSIKEQNNTIYTQAFLYETNENN